MWAHVGIFVSGLMKLRPRKFVPQHLAPRVTCEQFLLDYTCEFEIWWQLWIVGFYNFPTSNTFPRSALGGSSVTPRVYGIKCWSLLHVLSSVPFMFTSKGLALVISYFIILLGPKNRVRNAERKSFLLSFSIFGQGWESNTIFNQSRERVSEIFGQIEREIEPFLILFHCLQPIVRERGQRPGFGEGLHYFSLSLLISAKWEKDPQLFFLLPVVAVGILLLFFSFPWETIPLVL